MKSPGLDEGDAQQTKKQFVDTIVATSTSAITVNTITCTTSTNATTVTTFKFIPKGMNVKFSWNIEGEDKLNLDTLYVCKLSKGVSAKS